MIVRWSRFAVLMPVVVGCVYLFLYLPIMVLALFSFNSNPLGYQWQGFTTHWYNELFSSSEVWDALKNSLVVAGASATISISMATSLVLAMKSRMLGRAVFLFYANLAVPEIVLAVALLGLFSFFSVSLGVTTLIAVHTLLGLGYAVPLIYARFEAIDRRFVEASIDLGATRMQTIRYVVLPLLMPAIMASALLVFIVSFDDFILSFFCSGGSTETLPMYIFSMLRADIAPIISALSVVLLVISSSIILLFSSLQMRKMGMMQ